MVRRVGKGEGFGRYCKLSCSKVAHGTQGQGVGSGLVAGGRVHHRVGGRGSCLALSMGE